MIPRPNILKCFFLFVFISGAFFLKAQTVVYVNDRLKLSESDILFVNGYVQTDTNSNFDNGGSVFITDSLVNHADTLFQASSYGKYDNSRRDDYEKFVLKDRMGKVIFLDDTLSKIVAYKKILFDTVIFNNPAGVSLFESDTIAVLGGLEFREGVFNLNGHAVKMYFYGNGTRQPRTSGVLINENNSSRVVDTRNTGSIVMVKNLSNGGEDRFGSLGIEPNANLGTGTKIVRYHTSDTIKLRVKSFEFRVKS